MRVFILCLLLLAGSCSIPAGAESAGPVEPFQVWGSYQIPSDSGFKDIYSGLPGFGASYFVPALPWGGFEFAAGYHWASGNPVAGPFVQKAEAGYRALPITVAFRFDPSPKPIRPYGRVGFVVSRSNSLGNMASQTAALAYCRVALVSGDVGAGNRADPGGFTSNG